MVKIVAITIHIKELNLAKLALIILGNYYSLRSMLNVAHSEIFKHIWMSDN
jgi:hypothetical protein